MLDVRIEKRKSFTVVYVAGELSGVENERLSEVLDEVAYGSDARVAVELSGLKTIDSSGLAALITMVTRSRLTHGRVVLVAPSPFVTGVLSVTRLDGWFDVCKSLADAEPLLS